jgi:hypothetical protein
MGEMGWREEDLPSRKWDGGRRSLLVIEVGRASAMNGLAHWLQSWRTARWLFAIGEL